MGAEKEFKYVEFIRNPRKSLNGNEDKLYWMAFDYFDFIYIKEVKQFVECMDYQNEIPCEAYQSIGIFREKQEKSSETELPFIAVLQVTFMLEAYQEAVENGTDKKVFYEQSMEELKDIVGEAHEFDKNCEMNFGVYYTVNNIDFCILLYSDRLDLAEYTSNKIKEKLTLQGGPKYSVYTTVGISRDFCVEQNRQYMDEDTVLVSRILLKRKFYDKENIKTFCEKIKNKNLDNQKCITNTHSLPGKYELSIRVNGRDDILRVLPLIIRFKFDENEAADDTCEKESCTSSISYLLSNDCVRYINARIFYSSCNTFGNIGSDFINFGSEESKQRQEKQQDECLSLEESVNKLEKKFSAMAEGQEEKYAYFEFVIREYLEKLKRIIHTCEALSFNDDTKVSMMMLKDYLDSFLHLLQLNAEFLEKNLIEQKDYAMNVLMGLNYIEQYTKIVTSVNGNSFETPQFGTERDECSIGKISIAYTEYFGRFSIVIIKNERMIILEKEMQRHNIFHNIFP